MNNTKQQLLDNVMAVVAELENPETSAMDWLDEQLNIESYTISPDGSFKGFEVLCTFGGPNIWVTDSHVHGAWGSDSFERSYDDNIGLYELLEEFHACL